MDNTYATGLRWKKSSRSNGQANCVEVAYLAPSRLALRDSKQGDLGPRLIIGAAQWGQFVRQATEPAAHGTG